MSEDISLERVELRLGSTSFLFHGQITRGAITAVTGSSGAGKSTLLNLIAGFEYPDTGRILISGEDQTDRHPSERPVSIVFQDHNLFAHLDIFTNVGLGISPAMRLSTPDRVRVAEALERVGLKGFERRMPGSLSGGERQRAAFARALVRRRPILLLDEPFASLDASLRHQMSDLLLDLHRTVPTIVVVSHDQQEIARIADRTLAVADGKIIHCGPNEQHNGRSGLSPGSCRDHA